MQTLRVSSQEKRFFPRKNIFLHKSIGGSYVSQRRRTPYSSKVCNFDQTAAGLRAILVNLGEMGMLGSERSEPWAKTILHRRRVT
jgi:hypothetical protein